MRKAIDVAIAVVVLLGWLFMGVTSKALALAWLGGFVWIVARTRMWRMPRSLHLALWMAALLLATVYRAWRMDELVSTWDQGEIRHWTNAEQRENIRVVIDSLLTGFSAGLTAGIELLVIGFGTCVGGWLRPDRKPSRVGFWRRAAVVVLHVPLATALCAASVALIASAVRRWSQTDVLDLNVRTGLAVGAVLWLVFVVHLDRLFAIGAGGRTTRFLLGLIGLVATVTVIAGGPGVLTGALLIVWCIAQLAALWNACA